MAQGCSCHRKRATSKATHVPNTCLWPTHVIIWLHCQELLTRGNLSPDGKEQNLPQEDTRLAVWPDCKDGGIERFTP